MIQRQYGKLSTNYQLDIILADIQSIGILPRLSWWLMLVQLRVYMYHVSHLFPSLLFQSVLYYVTHWRCCSNTSITTSIELLFNCVMNWSNGNLWKQLEDDRITYTSRYSTWTSSSLSSTSSKVSTDNFQTDMLMMATITQMLNDFVTFCLWSLHFLLYLRSNVLILPTN